GNATSGDAFAPFEAVSAGGDRDGGEGELGGDALDLLAVHEDGAVGEVAAQDEEPGRVRRGDVQDEALGGLLEDAELAGARGARGDGARLDDDLSVGQG